jgi:alpha-glucosidase
MSKFTLLVVFFCGLNFFGQTKELRLKSPSENLIVKILNEDGSLNLELTSSKKIILDIDLKGFVIDKDIDLKRFEITNSKKSSKKEKWIPVYGERNSVLNKFNEIELTLVCNENSKDIIKLICRAYDEGIAFYYSFDPELYENTVVSEELTTFNFKNDSEAWITNKAQGHYKKDKISTITKGVERPLVVEQSSTSFLAIGEAALVDFARMKFKNNPHKEFSIQTELQGKAALKQAQYKTPWRFVMVGTSAGELLTNNYFLENLNAPNEIEDSSWIKPGKVIREVTLTTKGGIACVDFAAKHNIEYVEFDAGWYGNEHDEASDATTITVDPKRSPGPLELLHVIDYANKKGVGVILYVNRRSLEKQLDTVLPKLHSWGVKGIKYGFVNVGSQKWTSWLHDAIRKAAKYKLMVDVHDEYRPTGYSRTYPNLMTQEGIRGDEESPSSEHTLATLFTRMIAGAGDNTNCYLAPRVVEKMGGKAGQMAKTILIYSPWQFVYWYDRPVASPIKKGGAGAATGVLNESEELKFYDALPTVWDKTEVLEGEIGKYATIARKNGEDWFIGSLVANTERVVEIPLTFLDKRGAYEAILYFQTKEDLNKNKVSQEKIRVNSKTILTRTLFSNSGMAIILKKK